MAAAARRGLHGGGASGDAVGGVQKPLEMLAILSHESMCETCGSSREASSGGKTGTERVQARERSGRQAQALQEGADSSSDKTPSKSPVLVKSSSSSKGVSTWTLFDAVVPICC